MQDGNSTEIEVRRYFSVSNHSQILISDNLVSIIENRFIANASW
jgi:hypothetical protein